MHVALSFQHAVTPISSLVLVPVLAMMGSHGGATQRTKKCCSVSLLRSSVRPPRSCNRYHVTAWASAGGLSARYGRIRCSSWVRKRQHMRGISPDLTSVRAKLARMMCQWICGHLQCSVVISIPVAFFVMPCLFFAILRALHEFRSCRNPVDRAFSTPMTCAST